MCECEHVCVCVCACVRMWCVRACVRVCAAGWQGKAARLMTAHAIVQRQLWNAPVQRPKNTPKCVTLTALTRMVNTSSARPHTEARKRSAPTSTSYMRRRHSATLFYHWDWGWLAHAVWDGCGGVEGSGTAVACSCNIAQKVVVPLLGFAFEIVQHTGMNAHDGEISGAKMLPNRKLKMFGAQVGLGPPQAVSRMLFDFCPTPKH